MAVRSAVSDEMVVTRRTIAQLDCRRAGQYGHGKMKCPRCASDNRPGRRFCGACGAPMQSSCPSCSFQNEPDERFCGGCGKALAGEARESPHAYTPKHLAERILISRAAMEGERKQVSVLFCDIVDSSRLAATMEPETMHEIMGRVLRLMAEAVHRYEGTVNQFLGDGLMALFGAPIALEDHALRAVHAALAIQDTVTAYGRELGRDLGVDLRLRIGINTGPVVVGRIGDDLRMDYTAVGDTTHLAARLQTLCAPGGVLVSEPTYRAVEGYVRADALGPAEVKGRAEPVRVWNVTGRRGRRSRLEVRIERGLSPLAGRHEELKLLADRWERAVGPGSSRGRGRRGRCRQVATALRVSAVAGGRAGGVARGTMRERRAGDAVPTATRDPPGHLPDRGRRPSPPGGRKTSPRSGAAGARRR